MTAAFATLQLTEERLGGSFRDPAGFVFKADGKVYRHVSPVYRPQYEQLMTSGLYEALTAARLLIPHSEVYSPEQ